MIALVALLFQKVHENDNMSNSLCFKKEKQFTRGVECFFPKQYQFLMWYREKLFVIALNERGSEEHTAQG